MPTGVSGGLTRESPAGPTWPERPVPVRDDEVGELFVGRYEFIDVIGNGATGSVWRVYDHRDGRMIAAKALQKSDKTSLLRFVLEQAVRINHPHVLSPLGGAAVNKRVILTMPLADGGSVTGLVAEAGVLPPLFVAECLRQLLSALNAVHAAGIVHRDVSPANVLLKATGTGRPHVYLSDFGIAAHRGGPYLPRAENMSGTRGFAAPEQTDGSDPAPSADLYSAGQVARQMLTGWPPTSHLAADPPPGTPGALWQVITGLTELDVPRRLTADEALELLAAPELAWVPEAIGPVNLGSHVDLGMPERLHRRSMDTPFDDEAFDEHPARHEPGMIHVSERLVVASALLVLMFGVVLGLAIATL